MIVVSCSTRYLKYYKTTLRLNNGKITRAEYDSTIQTIYRLQKNSLKLDDRVKLSGSYVRKENCYSYEECKMRYMVRKFTDSGMVFQSFWINDSLTNKIFSKSEYGTEHWTVKDNEIIIEYLLFRDHDVYNIFKYAKISKTGDTLTFYKTENLQRPNEKKRVEKEEIYIYNPTLTSLPKLSNTK